MNRQKSDNRGFTLLEIIITLIIAAIVGSMLIPYIGTNLTRSSMVVVSVQQQQQLVQVMENITADYKRLQIADASPLSTLVSRVGPAGSNQDNSYGKYSVVVNRRISFTTGNPATEQEDANGKMQKITISYQGQNLTALFGM
ncbi:MAG: prepilin-type N-terminal cleavage/methylation domain-containing protein [Pseudomonadota bacterium]|nr:prepilin-type N-terminal cleavage/methylation domain-containing protein [Pseudomonadota bacterium]